MGRGMARAALRQYRDAIDDFDQCLSLKPNYEEALVERSLAYTGAGDHGRANQDLTAALKLQPEDVRAWRVRGAVRERLGDDEGAVADYGEAIQRDPKDARLYLARGAVYARMNALPGCPAGSRSGGPARSPESRRLRGARRLVP